VEKHQQKTISANRLVRFFVVAVIACGLTAFVFSPAGPFYVLLKYDLSFLILPLSGFFIFRMISHLSRLVFASLYGELFALGMKISGWMFLSYFVLTGSPLLARIPFMSGWEDFFNNLTQIPGYILCFIAGLMMPRISQLVVLISKYEKYIPMLQCTGKLLLGYGLWQSLAAWSQFWQPLDSIGLAIFCGFLFMAISCLFEFGLKMSDSLIIDASFWMVNGPAGKFLSGLAIAVYFLIVRPIIMSYFPSAYLIEWLLMCVIAWYILHAVKVRLNKAHEVDISERWCKHIQQVNDLPNDNFEKLVAIQEDFIETGSRHDLLLQLKYILLLNGKSEEQIGSILSSIIEFNDRKIPFFAIGPWKKRFIKINRIHRISSLDLTMKALDDAI